MSEKQQETAVFWVSDVITLLIGIGRRLAGLLGDKVDSYPHLARFPLVSAIMRPSLEVLWWFTCHACEQAVRLVCRDKDHHRQRYPPDLTRSF
ncbi:hypothetical protein PGB90_002539 [Kerria lacca]